MNYTREDLIKSDATMNQMRNAIYHLQRFMKLNGISEVRDRLRNIGKNIAHTYFNYWKPIEYVDISNLKDVIATIYKNVLSSSVSIELDDNNKVVRVRDTDCPLCKYHFNDIEVAGCEVISAMVSEFISLINNELDEKKTFKITNLEIEESKALGHKNCIQIYKYNERGV